MPTDCTRPGWFDWELRDSHLAWPVFGYTLSTSVWVLTHVWYRPTDGTSLFPRVLDAPRLGPEGVLHELRSCLESCREGMGKAPHIVAMEPNSDPMVWSLDGTSWREPWHCEFVQALLSRSNRVGPSLGGAPTHRTEGFGLDFYVQVQSQCVAYSEDEQSRLVMAEHVTLPSRPYCMPRVVFGQEIPGLLHHGKPFLGWCMAAMRFVRRPKEGGLVPMDLGLPTPRTGGTSL